MNRQREREEFLVKMSKENVPLEVSRLVMRAAATLHRLAELECNGHGWEDHYKRKPCPQTAPIAEGTSCPDCGAFGQHDVVTSGTLYIARTERAKQALIARHLKPYNVTPIFQGDPRGAVVKLKVPSGKTDDMGREGICVP